MKFEHLVGKLEEIVGLKAVVEVGFRCEYSYAKDLRFDTPSGYKVTLVRVASRNGREWFPIPNGGSHSYKLFQFCYSKFYEMNKKSELYDDGLP